MLGATLLSARGFREGESELRVSIGDEGVVLASVLSFAQAGLSQGPQPKSQSRRNVPGQAEQCKRLFGQY